MTSDDPAQKTPSQKLAEILARKNAAAQKGAPPVFSGRASERMAAAHSASKSKPALRKG